MACDVHSVDSNSTGLSIAEEECIKVLPGVNGADAVWQALEPNGYPGDFGATISTVARNPLNPSRQRRKGAIVDIDASGGFNTDHTASNMTELLQGFFFADLRVKSTTIPTPDGGTAPGFEFAAGDVAATVAGGKLVLTATAATMNDKGLAAGDWVFLGGDDADTRLGTNVGFARIQSITAKAITFDITTFEPVADAGAAVTLQMYFSKFLRNENDPALIKRRTYQLERTLGQDAAGTQSQYLIGAVPNEFTLNVPQGDKLNCDLTFLACDQEVRTGLQGLKPGTRVAAPGEDALNTSTDVYQMKLYIVNPVDSTPTPLFGFLQEGSISINNNVSPLKGIGVAGAFDMSAGTFEVGGDVTAYFTDVAAINAIRANADVGFYTAICAKNKGIIYDIPLLGIDGGQLNIEADTPVTIPVGMQAAENPQGYTLSYSQFDYLPNIAMPQ